LASITFTIADINEKHRNISMSGTLIKLEDSQGNIRNLDNQKISTSDRYGVGNTRDGKLYVEQNRLSYYVATVDQGEMVNTAILDNKATSRMVNVWGFHTKLAFETSQETVRKYFPFREEGDVTCKSSDPEALKVDGGCRSVFMDGSETRGSDRVEISVTLDGSSSVIAEFGVRVWFPDPVVVRLSDSQLNRINGWTSNTDCRTFEYQRARFTVHTFFRTSSNSTSFFADVTSLVEEHVSVENETVGTIKNGLLTGLSPGSSRLLIGNDSTVGGIPFSVTTMAVDAVQLDVKIVASVSLSIERSSLPRHSNQTVTLTVEDKLTREGELADVTISVVFEDGTRRLLSVPNPDLTLSSLNSSVVTIDDQDTLFVRAVSEGTTDVVANLTVCGDFIALGSTEVQFQRKQVPCFKEQVYRKSVSENSRTDNSLQLHIDVDPVDREDAGVEFEVLSGDTKLFTVDVETGWIRILEPLDRETEATYTITVRVTDKAQREALRKLLRNQTEEELGSASGLPNTTDNRIDPVSNDNLQPCDTTIIITVLDENDNIPECSNIDIPLLSQAESIGFEIAVAQATDPDYGKNGTVTYTIVGGDANERFMIDEFSGSIVIANNLSTDLTQYLLQIEAKDGGDRVDTCFVTVSTYNPDWLVCVPTSGITKDKFSTIKDEFQQRLGEILGLDVYIAEYNEVVDDGVGLRVCFYAFDNDDNRVSSSQLLGILRDKVREVSLYAEELKFEFRADVKAIEC
jgi:hypothetical protein